MICSFECVNLARNGWLTTLTTLDKHLVYSSFFTINTKLPVLSMLASTVFPESKKVTSTGVGNYGGNFLTVVKNFDTNIDTIGNFLLIVKNSI